MSELHSEVPREIRQYLIPIESIVFRMRVHWFRVLEPIASTVGGLLLLGILDQLLPPRLPLVRDVLVIAWLMLVLRLSWYLIDWQREWFLVTDRRIMLVHGVIVRKVAIMPLSKVTDMTYNRTPIGKLFGYGEFVLESAGQDQALSRVKFVKNPNFYYRVLSSVIFAPPNRRSYDKLLPTSTGTAMPIAEPEDAWWKRP